MWKAKSACTTERRWSGLVYITCQSYRQTQTQIKYLLWPVGGQQSTHDHQLIPKCIMGYWLFQHEDLPPCIYRFLCTGQRKNYPAHEIVFRAAAGDPRGQIPPFRQFPKPHLDPTPQNGHNGRKKKTYRSDQLGVVQMRQRFAGNKHVTYRVLKYRALNPTLLSHKLLLTI